MSTPPLSFDRAHYEGDPPPADACAFCKRGLIGDYYRVADHLACATCAANAQALVPPDTYTVYARALSFGVAAAIVGCLIYAAIGLHIVIGYVAIGVGYMIGWAMKKGSGGLGGRRFQITAVILTYLAIAMAYMPQVIYVLWSKGLGLGWSFLGLLQLAGTAIISPFTNFSTEPGSAAIDLFILFLGVRYAWNFTKGKHVEVLGPFTA